LLKKPKQHGFYIFLLYKCNTRNKDKTKENT